MVEIAIIAKGDEQAMTTTNIANRIETLLDSHTKGILQRVGEYRARQGIDAILVGRTVRDLHLGKRPLDIDISISFRLRLGR